MYLFWYFLKTQNRCPILVFPLHKLLIMAIPIKIKTENENFLYCISSFFGNWSLFIARMESVYLFLG